MFADPMLWNVEQFDFQALQPYPPKASFLEFDFSTECKLHWGICPGAFTVRTFVPCSSTANK